MKNIVQFDLGRVVATRGAHEEFDLFEMHQMLHRHASGDWGDLEAEDKRLNDEAVHDGSRILSRYDLSGDRSAYVITEAADDLGRRSYTTVLLPSEY